MWIRYHTHVTPHAGTAMIFRGDVTHAGLPVTAGVRYVLVMSFSLNPRAGTAVNDGQRYDFSSATIPSDCTALNLNGKKIGDVGAVALAEALKTNTALEMVLLAGNSISDVGAAALADALQTNTALATLYLGYNLISEVGAAALAKGLKTNSVLSALDKAEVS